jgi:hypothetical protein
VSVPVLLTGTEEIQAASRISMRKIIRKSFRIALVVSYATIALAVAIAWARRTPFSGETVERILLPGWVAFCFVVETGERFGAWLIWPGGPGVMLLAVPVVSWLFWTVVCFPFVFLCLRCMRRTGVKGAS